MNSAARPQRGSSSGIEMRSVTGSDGREHAIRLLDHLNAPAVDAAWTPISRMSLAETTRASAEQGKTRSPLTDSNGRPPPYHLTTNASGRKPRQRIWLVFAHFAV